MRLPAAALAVLALLLCASQRSLVGADTEPATGEEKALARALEIEEELVGALEKVRRVTVSVLHLRRVGAKDLPPVAVGCGSGVLVTQKGTWVVTNVHVVQGSDAVQVVTSDGRRHPVRVFDTIDKYDIALLAFENEKEPKGYRGITIKAARGVEEGSWVVATGNPFWLALDGQSVATVGVVSGLDRILGGKFLYGKAIQHDAEVNPGNSGGPLWNLKGEFIGINGMIASEQTDGSGPHNTGASFSIPSEQVASFLTKMIAAKSPTAAGDLGVRCETFVEKDGTPGGALVTGVNEAIHSGTKSLQKGDVIKSLVVKGRTESIRTASDLTNLLALLSADTAVKVAYRRNRSMATWSGKLLAQ